MDIDTLAEDYTDFSIKGYAYTNIDSDTRELMRSAIKSAFLAGAKVQEAKDKHYLEKQRDKFLEHGH